jgi:hypothetical protein
MMYLSFDTAVYTNLISCKICFLLCCYCCSWFPGVYDEFLVKPQKEYHYTIWLLPFTKNDDLASVAWNVQ